MKLKMIETGQFSWDCGDFKISQIGLLYNIYHRSNTDKVIITFECLSKCSTFIEGATFGINFATDNANFTTTQEDQKEKTRILVQSFLNRSAGGMDFDIYKKAVKRIKQLTRHEFKDATELIQNLYVYPFNAWPIKRVHIYNILDFLVTTGELEWRCNPKGLGYMDMYKIKNKGDSFE